MRHDDLRHPGAHRCADRHCVHRRDAGHHDAAGRLLRAAAVCAGRRSAIRSGLRIVMQPGRGGFRVRRLAHRAQRTRAGECVSVRPDAGRDPGGNRLPDGHCVPAVRHARDDRQQADHPQDEPGVRLPACRHSWDDLPPGGPDVHLPVCPHSWVGHHAADRRHRAADGSGDPGGRLHRRTRDASHLCGSAPWPCCFRCRTARHGARVRRCVRWADRRAGRPVWRGLGAST